MSVVLLSAGLILVALLRPAGAAPQSWTVSVGRTPVALAVAARSGRLVVASSADQTVRLLDARTGATLATSTLGQSPLALAVDETHGRVFTLNACVVSLVHPEPTCPHGASSVSVLDLRRGTLLGTVRLGSGATALVVDERAGRLFVASAAADTVSVLAASTGRLLATVDLNGAPLATVVDAPLQHLFLSTHDAFPGKSSVCVLDSRTGALLNVVPVGQHVGAVLGDARAERVLVASDGDLYLLDARTGQVLRHITAGGVPLAVDERAGHALIGGAGHLHLIATRDGALMAPVTGPAAVDGLAVAAVGVDEVTGRFYMATDRAVLALDGHSGRMWRARSLPGTPVSLAVDPAAQRVYVLTRPTLGDPQGPATPLPLRQWLRRTLPWLPLPATPPTASGTLTVLDTTHL